MKKISPFILVALIFLVSACSGTVEDTPTPVSAFTPTSMQVVEEEETSSAYPLPERYVPPTLSYPLPPTEVPVFASSEFTIPAPDDESGVVIGQLIDIDTNELLAGQSVYLGQKIFHTPGPDYSIGVQEMSSPHTIANSEGRFALGDVEPGEYVILVWTPFNAYIITDPITNIEVQVRVNAGETLDLGVLMAKNPLDTP
jgi:hypothetical protein